MKHEDKSLAIIIPNYNKDKFISDTLNSIMSQTLIPNEIIIVDDHSNDESQKVILDYSKKYNIIKPFFLAENKGVQFARNYGLSKARSRFVCFVDSDDIYLNNECIAKQMIKAGHNKLVGVYQLMIDSNNKIISNEVSKKQKRKSKRSPISLFYSLNDFNCWPFHYIVEKQAVLDVGAYNNRYSLYEDADLLLKLVLKGVKPIWINIYGKGYRIDRLDANHLSNAPFERHKEASEYFWDKYKKQLPLHCKISLILKSFKKFLKNLI